MAGNSNGDGAMPDGAAQQTVNRSAHSRAHVTD